MRSPSEFWGRHEIFHYLTYHVLDGRKGARTMKQSFCGGLTARGIASDFPQLCRQEMHDVGGRGGPSHTGCEPPHPAPFLACIADRTASLLQKCCSFCGTEGLKNTLLKVGSTEINLSGNTQSGVLQARPHNCRLFGSEVHVLQQTQECKYSQWIHVIYPFKAGVYAVMNSTC